MSATPVEAVLYLQPQAKEDLLDELFKRFCIGK